MLENTPHKPGDLHQMIHSLQAYRGFAALLVVLYHSHQIMSGYFETSGLTEFFLFGHAGVEFFFVLSGFIIYSVHHRDIGSPGALGPYLKKRFVRIYPVYWVVTFIFLPFWLLVPEFGQPFHKEFGALIKSLLLFPQTHDPHVEVGWTLVFEVFFYLLFATAILSKRVGLTIIVLWFTVVTTSILTGYRFDFPLSFVFSHYNLLFCLGIAAAMVQPSIAKGRLSASFALTLFVLANLSFLAAGLYENYVSNTRSPLLWFGISACVIVAVSPHPAIERFWRGRNLSVFLGDASYSIYLIHTMIISFCCKVLTILPFSEHLPTAVIFIALAVVATIGGCVFHLIVERPLLNICRQRIGPRMAVAHNTTNS